MHITKFPYHLGVITVDEACDLEGQHQLLVDGRVSRYLQHEQESNIGGIAL